MPQWNSVEMYYLFRLFLAMIFEMYAILENMTKQQLEWNMCCVIYAWEISGNNQTSL